MGSRSDDLDDDFDDRPRPRRRKDDDDYDDDFDRPRRRGPRRRSGPGVGKVIGIVVGSLAALGVVGAIVYVIVNGKGASFGGGSISYEQYTAIGEKDTIADLEKRHGRGKKIEPSEWATTGPGAEERNRKGKNGFWVQQGSTLAEYGASAEEVTAWYRWKKGQEEVYVAEGRDLNGRRGLVIKIYFNPKLLEEAVTKPGGGRTVHPWFIVEQIGVGTKMQFGGNGP